MVTSTVVQADLLKEASVKRLLEIVELSYSYSYGDLDDYVPRSMVTKLSEELASGDVGAQALGGYVAFGMGSVTNHVLKAGWVVVMDLYGNVETISITYGALIGTPNISATNMYHPIALRPHSATHFLCAWA